MTIKELRKKAGMTQHQFGEYVGVNPRTVQKWELGERECPEHLLNLIAYKLEHDLGCKAEDGKVAIVLDRKHAESLRLLLGSMNQYAVGAAICVDGVALGEDDVKDVYGAVIRAHQIIEDALKK